MYGSIMTFHILSHQTKVHSLRHKLCRSLCYSRTLAPNITNLFFSFSLSYLFSWLIRSPFSLMTAMLPSHQACACPLPRAVHDFHFTSVLCTPMLLHSFTTYLMLTSFLSLRLCLLLFHSRLCLMHTPYACLSYLYFYSATAMRLHHALLPFHGYAWCMPLNTCYLDT